MTKSTRAVASRADVPGLGHNSYHIVEQLPVDPLIQDGVDPRSFSRRETKKATAILRRLKYVPPIVVGSENNVLAGYLLVLAARALGRATLPGVRAENLSQAEQRALSIALNRLGELGDFDRIKLGNLVLQLEADLPELQVEDLGLSVTEVDLAIFAAQGSAVAEGPFLAPSGPAVTRPGDNWLLDKHRVAHGNATQQVSYVALMAGSRAHAIFTDPPYGIGVDSISTRGHRTFVEGAEGNKDGQLDRLFAGFCEAMVAHARPGALAYIAIDWRSLEILLRAARPFLGDLLNLIVWGKDRAGMGSHYKSQHEEILLFKVPGAPHRNNIELGVNGRNRSNLWSYPSALTMSRRGDEGDLLAHHPTPKNVDMVADAILDSTRRRDIVLDPFLGSGTTLIAAERTGRRCFGMDLDPLYVDLAVRRWQSLTGREAIHAQTRRAFDRVASETREDTL
ncbi:MAG: DNA modification methylase [Sphingosinicella sp.]|uniref:DNA modification methylase n=1 Tax=Sphingosinicella sp. TaxID=1917971 RepID=UPI00403799E4